MASDDAMRRARLDEQRQAIIAEGRDIERLERILARMPALHVTVRARLTTALEDRKRSLKQDFSTNDAMRRQVHIRKAMEGMDTPGVMLNGRP